MKERFEKWKYLNLSKGTIISFKDRVAFDNLRILSAESIVVCALCFLSSILKLYTKGGLVKQLTLIVSAFIFFIIFFFSAELRNKGIRRLYRGVNTLIFIFRLSLFAMTLVLGMYNYSDYSVLFIIAVLLTLVSFDILPIDCAFSTSFAVLIYVILSFFFKDRRILGYDFGYVFSSAVLGGFISWEKAKVKYEHVELLELVERNKSQVYRSNQTDSLTGLLNRRNAFEKLEVVTAQSGVSGREMICMIMDLDNFKKYNDTYGHAKGDRLLEDIGKVLLGVSVEHAISMARIGGEEFMSFWIPERNDEAKYIADEILTKVRLINDSSEEDGLPTTISIGVFQGIASVSDNASGIYSKADNAVYDAKKNGRDRVEFYDTSIEK